MMHLALLWLAALAVLCVIALLVGFLSHLFPWKGNLYLIGKDGHFLPGVFYGVTVTDKNGFELAPSWKPRIQRGRIIHQKELKIPAGIKLKVETRRSKYDGEFVFLVGEMSFRGHLYAFVLNQNEGGSFVNAFSDVCLNDGSFCYPDLNPCLRRWSKRHQLSCGSPIEPAATKREVDHYRLPEGAAFLFTLYELSEAQLQEVVEACLAMPIPPLLENSEI